MSYNVQEAAKQLMLDKEVLLGIYEIFFEDMADIMQQFDSAVQSADYSALAALFHTLKGVTANVCMHSLSQQAFLLENEAKSENMETVKPLFEQFRRHYEEVTATIKRHYNMRD